MKSSTSVTDVYLIDAALQYLVITKAGFKVNDFSIIYIDNPYLRKGGELQHFEFLVYADDDPRIPFIENFFQDVKTTGDILVYNKAFEIKRFNEIVKAFPKYKMKIENLIFRIKDLSVLFQKKLLHK